MTAQPPLAIGFDFDHTLGIDNGLERKALYAYAGELGRPLDPADAVVRRQVDELLAAFRAGTFDLDAMVRRFGALIGAADAQPQRWREHCYALVDPLVRPVDGARELLRRLRELAIPAAILTNGWTPLQQRKIARALGADGAMPLLVSDVLHVVKPDRAAFDALVAVLGVARARCWYVGDNPRGDAGGALAAGLEAVWFDEGVESYPQDLPPPAFRVTSLRELETIVENTIAP